jgi:hypothetical protein
MDVSFLFDVLIPIRYRGWDHSVDLFAILNIDLILRLLGQLKQSKRGERKLNKIHQRKMDFFGGEWGE